MNKLLAVLTVGIAGALLSACGGGGGSGNTITKETFPIVTGWFGDQMVQYIQTEASDPAVAMAQNVNYVPALANALTSTTSAVDDIYVVTNFTQPNVIPSAPTPAGPGNTSTTYSPLWRVSTVTWNVPANATALTSEAAVLAAQVAGKVTLTKTGIIVNCPVVFSPQGGTLPTVTIHPATANSVATVTFPTVNGWFNDKMVRYIQTEASDSAVAMSQNVNYVPALANVLTATTTAVDDIYVVTNFTQPNVIPSAPTPAGPGNTSTAYSPLWRVSVVTWVNSANATALTSEAAVLAAKAAGKITVTQTGIVVNCPVVFSPQGGVLPTVTES